VNARSTMCEFARNEAICSDSARVGHRRLAVAFIDVPMAGRTAGIGIVDLIHRASFDPPSP
jgi:hypothetical protein